MQDFEPVSSPTAVKIVDAASNLFLQRGYKAVSINDIIREADVTKPTLYYYFVDKEALFVQMGLRVLAEMGERLRYAAARPGGLAERLVAVATVLMANRDTDMRLMRHEMAAHLGPGHRAILGRAFYAQLFTPIVEVMEAGLADGELARYSALTLAKMFMGMAEAFQEFASRTVEGWEHQPETLFGTSDLDPHALVDLFIHGVGITKE
ncbi:TetR/AcrR family transcriptional regulator [Candidatus Chloroploca sp. Khr17]|uniref:TetR/AcrR family transcriptional regulator n=1 Tax=Candidatus Chloroploca sp. Khr17 TaxID=2496869 RepID=UPI00101B8535|nr:TetR/AcrR family transcriptional regulator [Candidatus Chloroploca sp. Khr17]